MNTTDVIAYLLVLGYEPAIDRISGFVSLSLLEAKHNIVGCLCRIENSLADSDDEDERGLLELIRYRERLNGFQDKYHPQLQSATRSLAKVLSLWLEEQRYGGKRQYRD